MLLSPEKMVEMFPNLNQNPTYRYALYFSHLKDGKDGRKVSDCGPLTLFGEYISLTIVLHIGWTELGRNFSPAWGIWDKKHQKWVNNPHQSN